MDEVWARVPSREGVDKMGENMRGKMGLVSDVVTYVILEAKDFGPPPFIDDGCVEEASIGISQAKPVYSGFGSLEFFLHLKEIFIVF